MSHRFRTHTILSLLITWLAALGVVPCAAASSTVARVKERTITLEELDRAGGRAVYDAAEQLHEARVRALYQLLSEDLLAREARAQHVSVDQLLEREVNARVSVPNDAEVTQLLDSKSGAPAEPRARKEAELYLGLKRQSEAKREYIGRLMKKYGVRIALEAPPLPAPETIEGALEPHLGNADAAVTIVVFSDYLCPYCRDLSHTLDSLLEHDPQGIRVIYRSFPVHPQADVLAEAALCAADQGKFAEFHRLLFEKTPSVDTLPEVARGAGLSADELSRCLSSGTHRARVQSEREQGKNLRIEGTPTLFVNGQRLRGAQPLTRLVAQVERAKKSPPSATAIPTAKR